MSRRTPEWDSTLRKVASALSNLGFEIRRNAYFGTSGIVAFTPPERESDRRETSANQTVIERSVFIYPRADAWEARVTFHGGPHLVRQGRSVEDLVQLALVALERRPELRQWPEVD